MTHPDEEKPSSVYNFGEHRIMPSQNEDQSASLYDHRTNGLVSQAENNENCDKVDHNILNSKSFSINVENEKQSLKETVHINTRGTCIESLGFHVKKSELTIAKEQTTRSDKVC